MKCGYDFIMRPILKGLCKYESAKDGTLTIFDFLVMNEALDVEYYNSSPDK